MNTFHSSGTPIGHAEMMLRWKTSMIATAIKLTVPPCEKNNTTGTVNSMTVPECATNPANFDGRECPRGTSR